MNPLKPAKDVLLLVEDSSELALVVSLLGRRAGCEVQVRNTGEAAWHDLPQIRPSLVLLDINLPGMSGIELCEMLRGQPDWQALTVALFTHWSVPDDIVRGLQAGASCVFSKDLVVSPARWEKRLREILAPDAGPPPWRGEAAHPGVAALTPAEQVRRLLGHGIWRKRGQQLGRTIFEKAVCQVFPEQAGHSYLCRSDDHWLEEIAPGQAARLAEGLYHHMWRILGSEESAEVCRHEPSSPPDGAGATI